MMMKITMKMMKTIMKKVAGAADEVMGIWEVNTTTKKVIAVAGGLVVAIAMIRVMGMAREAAEAEVLQVVVHGEVLEAWVRKQLEN